MWATAFSWIGKLAGPLAPFKLQIFIGVGAALAILIGVHLWNDHTTKTKLESAKKQLVILEDRTAQHLHTIDQNRVAYQACLEINRQNAIDLSFQVQQSEQAAARVRTLTALNERNRQDIEREANELENDLGCPAFTDEFRQWLWDDSNQDDYRIRNR